MPACYIDCMVRISNASLSRYLSGGDLSNEPVSHLDCLSAPDEQHKGVDGSIT